MKKREIKKVMKYPVKARVEIIFDSHINHQKFMIMERYHLIYTLALGLSLGDEKGNFPNKIEIYDEKDRLIGEARI